MLLTGGSRWEKPHRSLLPALLPRTTCLPMEEKFTVLVHDLHQAQIRRVHTAVRSVDAHKDVDCSMEGSDISRCRSMLTTCAR